MRTLLLVAGLGFTVVPQLASAQQIAVRDRVSVDVPSSLFGSGPSMELRQEARKEAVDRAWRRYQAQNFSGARARTAQEHEPALRAVADQYCSFTFHDERFDADAKKFSLEVRGTCDQRAIDAAFGRLTPPGSAAAHRGGRNQRPLVSFVFLARRAANVTRHRENASTVATSGAETVTEGQQNSRTASRSSGAEEASVTQRSRESSTSFDAEYDYEVQGTDDAMTAVANVFTTNGFRVARYPELVTSCPGPSLGDLSRRYAEMQVNTAWSPKDTKAMFDAARQCRVPLFAFGLMDVLKSQQTSAEGVTVTVALNVKINDLSEMVPSECASINSQYQGTGRDRLEATNVALKRAAEHGTRELLDIVRQNCF